MMTFIISGIDGMERNINPQEYMLTKNKNNKIFEKKKKRKGIKIEYIYS